MSTTASGGGGFGGGGGSGGGLSTLANAARLATESTPKFIKKKYKTYL